MIVRTTPPERRSRVLIFTDGIDSASVVTARKLQAFARESDTAVHFARRLTVGEQWRLKYPDSKVEDVDMKRMLWGN